MNLPALFHKKVSIKRLDGIKEEHQAETIEENLLHIEWEWEESPEISVKIVNNLDIFGS